MEAILILMVMENGILILRLKLHIIIQNLSQRLLI